MTNSRVRASVEWLGAGAAGAALALAFPPMSLWPLAVVALAALVVVVRAAGSARDAAARGVLGAAAFFGVLLWWLLPYAAWFLPLVLPVIGLIWGPWAWLTWRVLRAPTGPARALAGVAIVPSAWVVTEYLRGWDRFAGPWGLLGTSQWQTSELLPLASVGGVWLLSALLATAAVAAAVAVAPAVTGRARLAAATAGAVAVLAGVGVAAAVSPPATDGTVRLAGIQPGVIDDPEDRLDRQIALTEQVEADVDVVVWGQMSVPFDPSAEPAVAARLQEAAEGVGAPLLVNVDERRPDGVYRTALLIRPDALGPRYDKMRLVPFGEYVPLRPVLGWVDDLTQAASLDIQPGRAVTVMEVGGARIGPLISYESFFPDLRRAVARLRADAVIVQGSLTSFQGSWAHAQQASVEAVRAVEIGRSGALVTLSGTSAAFDPTGSRLAWVDYQQSGDFAVELPLATGTTAYVRWGDWVVVVAAAVLLATAAASIIRRPPVSRRLRPAGASDAPAHPTPTARRTGGSSP